jgi:hypothetical protein
MIIVTGKDPARFDHGNREANPKGQDHNADEQSP